MNIWKQAGIIAVAMLLAFSCTACAAESPANTASTTEPPLSTDPPPVETTTATETQTPVTQPDTTSILDFLQIATKPVGSTMYVWGGGWNEEDTGAGEEAVTLGVSPQWAAFAAQQDSSYNYQNTRYQIHNGLDCSGYVGWAVYNVMETENGRPGYVCASTEMAKMLSDRGLGEYIPADEMTRWLPGDILSMKGHVWIAVGTCGDGSVLLLHASPPGVSFCGTTLPDGSSSQAVALAERIMKQYYPDWYSRYPDCARSGSYLTASAAMRWSSDVLSDEEELRGMPVEDVVAAIFGMW